MKYTYDATLRQHRWTADDKSVADPVVYTVIAYDVMDECADQEYLHGSKQKIGDAGAIPFNKVTKKYATDAEKLERMREVADRLQNERKFNADRTGPTKLVDVDVLVATIAGILRKPVIGVRAFIESKDEPGRRALADSAQFAETYILGVAAKRPRTDVDTSELDAIPDA